MKVACAFDHAGFPLKELVLEVVRELVRRVGEAAVLEVDQPRGAPVPHHVGGVEVGDAERVHSRLGKRRCGDEGPGCVERLRDEHRVATLPQLVVLAQPVDEDAGVLARSVATRTDAGSDHRLDGYVVQPPQ